MKVEAIKVENGFLIPDTDYLNKVGKTRVFLDIEVLDDEDDTEMYAPLDKVIGLCETQVSDASIHHDAIIYGKRGAA